MTQTQDAREAITLDNMKAERDALNDHIALIERGIEKAAYDAEMRRQLIKINERRQADGKRQMSEAEFASGTLTEDET